MASLVLALVGAGGCGAKKKAAPTDQAAVADLAAKTEDLKKDEEDVVSRRDELQRARKKISTDRAALQEKRKQVAAAGGDVAAVDKEEADLADREQSLVDQENTLMSKYDALMAKYESLSTPAGTGDKDDTARREAGMAVRESSVAKREDRLAEREKELADRERELAKREKETCGAGTTTIVQQVPTPPAGSRYTKKDVEPVLQRARRKMAEKGLLGADLPAQASELEKESTAAMAEGDYGKAKFAADQLYATVDAIKIDKAFVSAKIGRLNAAMRGKQLTAEQQQLFQGATADIGDGKFAAANAKLNRIYASLH